MASASSIFRVPEFPEPARTPLFVLLPEKKFDDFKGGPPETLPRVKGHQWEWIEACKGNGKTFSSFDIGGPLTELERKGQ